MTEREAKRKAARLLRLARKGEAKGGWTMKWPTRPGHYWFYGWPNGFLCGYDGMPNPPRLEHAEAWKDTFHLVVELGGKRWYESDNWTGLFCKADLPKLPDVSGLVKESEDD